MATINEREAFAANFERALRSAGMQDVDGGDILKPRYCRNRVPKPVQQEAIYLLYSVMDSPEAQAADNKPYSRTIYAYGTVYTRNGYFDSDYQKLIADIQTACEAVAPKITMLFGGEGVDISIDPDSPIDFINFTAYHKRLV